MTRTGSVDYLGMGCGACRSMRRATYFIHHLPPRIDIASKFKELPRLIDRLHTQASVCFHYGGCVDEVVYTLKSVGQR